MFTTLTVFFVCLFLLIITGAFFLGRKAAKNPQWRENPPAAAKLSLLAFLVFFGCFLFPIRSQVAPLDFFKLYLLLATYTAVGAAFPHIFKKSGFLFTYLSTLTCTALGMICGYFLEYGEVSNTYNFTPENIVSYLVLIPGFVVVVYELRLRHLKKI